MDSIVDDELNVNELLADEEPVEHVDGEDEGIEEMTGRVFVSRDCLTASALDDVDDFEVAAEFC